MSAKRTLYCDEEDSGWITVKWAGMGSPPNRGERREWTLIAAALTLIFLGADIALIRLGVRDAHELADWLLFAGFGLLAGLIEVACVAFSVQAAQR